jgi:hypothetical protein
MRWIPKGILARAKGNRGAGVLPSKYKLSSKQLHAVDV